MSKSITCKLTGKVGKSVKAHLIPRSFYHIDETPSLLMPSTNHLYPKRLNAGLYDPQIVTQDGEDILEKLDDYGGKLLILGREKLKPYKLEGEIVGLTTQSNKYDYQKLKLFLLSVLWRMSVSTRPEVKGVNLGPHENVIKDMILSSNPGNAEKYSITMLKYIEKATRGTVLFPAKEKMGPVNFYRLYISDYIALIKIDRRPTPPPFHLTKISPHSPLLIINRKFANSPEAKLLKNLIDKNTAKIPNWYIEAAKKSYKTNN